MKNLTLAFLVFLFICSACSAHKIVNEKRMVNFTEAKSRQEMLSMLQKQKRLGLLYVRGCNYVSLEEHVFKNPMVRKFIENNFYPVMSNWVIPGEKNYNPSDIHQYYTSDGLPVLKIIDFDGEITLDLQGYLGELDPDKARFVYYEGKELIKKLEEGLANAKMYAKIKKQNQINSTEDRAVLNYANRLIYKYKYEEAMPIYQELATRITNDSIKNAIYSNLLNIYLKPSYPLLTKYLDKAIQITEEGLAKGAYSSRAYDAYFALGNMYYWKRDYASCIKYYEKVPQNYEFLSNDYRSYLPISYIKTGQKEKGEAFVDEQLAQYFSLKDFVNLGSLASIYAENGMYFDKILHYLRQRKIFMNYDNYYLIRAYVTILMKENQVEKAIDIYQKMTDHFREKYPRWGGIPDVELAILYYRAGKPEKAIQILQDLDNHPERVNPGLTSYMSLSWVLYKNNVNVDIAKKWIRDALKKIGNEDIEGDSFDFNIIRNKYATIVLNSNAYSLGIELVTFNQHDNDNVE